MPQGHGNVGRRSQSRLGQRAGLAESPLPCARKRAEALAPLEAASQTAAADASLFILHRCYEEITVWASTSVQHSSAASAGSEQRQAVSAALAAWTAQVRTIWSGRLANSALCKVEANAAPQRRRILQLEAGFKLLNCCSS